MARNFHDEEMSATIIWEVAFAFVVMGILCAVLYWAKLPTVWQLSLILSGAVVLLSGIIAHGFQSVCCQIYNSNGHLIGAISEARSEQ